MLKFRLSDCRPLGEPAYWQEFPTQSVLARNTEGLLRPKDTDYYLSYGVPRGSALGTAPGKPVGLIDGITDFALSIIQAASPNSIIESKEVLPANQGLFLRWSVDGRIASPQSVLLNFFWGDFALRLQCDGKATLYQTTDYEHYVAVKSFQHDAQTGQYGTLTIFPHGRDTLEIQASFERAFTYGWIPNVLTGAPQPGAPQNGTATDGSGRNCALYNVPGDPADGIITKPGRWKLWVNPSIRPTVQVSKLAFYNGTDDVGANLKSATTQWDERQSLGPSSLGSIKLKAIADVPAGTILNIGSHHPGTQAPSKEGDSACQVYWQFKGKGDIRGDGAVASSVTPEMYGYIIHRGVVLGTSDETPFEVGVKNHSMNFGDSPEAERYSCGVDYGKPGSTERTNLDAIVGRSEFNTRLVHDGRTLFEGVVKDPIFRKHRPYGFEFDAVGMAHYLLTTHALDLDFSMDPLTGTGAWFWQSAVKECFKAAGWGEDKIVIEDPRPGSNKPSEYDFRLWEDGAPGGSKGSAVQGAGQLGQRWRPNPLSPIYQFMDFLVREVMGWNWTWDRSDRKWHIYQRPRPAHHAGLPVKATFIGGGRDERAAFVGSGPVYSHQQMKITTQRPKATNLICCAYYLAGDIETQAQLQSYLGASGTGPDPKEPSSQYEGRLVTKEYENPRGFRSPKHPNVSKQHPDYLGNQRTRVLKFERAGTKDAFEWMGRRAYEDLCIGHVFADFTADWGDQYTYNLRKYDVVKLDTGPGGALEKWFIHRIDPDWERDMTMFARYRCSKMREDAPPPR